MKIKNKKSYKRNIYIGVVFFTLLTSIIGIFIFSKKSSDVTLPNSNPPAVTVDKNADNNVNVTKNETSVTTTNTSILNITTTALGQDQKQGPILIRTIVDNITGGSCTYKLSKGSSIKNYSSEVSFSGTYYSCNYTIPYADLSPGTWTIKINVAQDNKSGTASKDVIVE
jgi:hypothetical protein